MEYALSTQDFTPSDSVLYVWLQSYLVNFISFIYCLFFYVDWVDSYYMDKMSVKCCCFYICQHN